MHCGCDPLVERFAVFIRLQDAMAFLKGQNAVYGSIDPFFRDYSFFNKIRDPGDIFIIVLHSFHGIQICGDQQDIAACFNCLFRHLKRMFN